jgi:ribosomal-protein-alanine N-acetyltransferase
MTTPRPSERLRFRAWCADDVEHAVALWGDPLVTALIDARGALDRAAVEERLAAEIAFGERSGVQYWPVLLKATGELVGCAGLHPREPDKRIFELGFHLCARFWGKGLAEEAARTATRFAFECLDATALFAGHHPKNAASARVLKKLGFRHTHDEPYAPTGLSHPSYLLVRADFDAPE